MYILHLDQLLSIELTWAQSSHEFLFPVLQPTPCGNIPACVKAHAWRRICDVFSTLPITWKYCYAISPEMQWHCTNRTLNLQGGCVGKDVDRYTRTCLRLDDEESVRPITCAAVQFVSRGVAVRIRELLVPINRQTTSTHRLRWSTCNRAHDTYPHESPLLRDNNVSQRDKFGMNMQVCGCLCMQCIAFSLQGTQYISG